MGGDVGLGCSDRDASADYCMGAWSPRRWPSDDGAPRKYLKRFSWRHGTKSPLFVAGTLDHVDNV